MSRATATLNALKAENLLAGSYLLSQIETLKAQLKYRSNGDTVSFDDYYLKLQKEVEDLPRLKLDNVVATGTENQYIMQLVKGLEQIFDDADRVVRRVIHFRSKLQNALSQIKKQGSAFNAWYTLAAGEQMEENGVKFPSNQLKDLAQSEYSRLMDNLDVEVESLMEAVKVQVEQIKVWKKTQSDKFNLGKDQANASWTSGLPNFGEGDRSDQLLEKSGMELEVDDDVPTFVSKKPQINPPEVKPVPIEEAIVNAKADIRLAGLPAPTISDSEIRALAKHVEEARNDPDYAVVGDRPTLETLQAENVVEDAKKPVGVLVDRSEVQGTFFKRGDAKPITPIVNDDKLSDFGPGPAVLAAAVPVPEMDIDKAAPVIQPAPSPIGTVKEVLTSGEIVVTLAPDKPADLTSVFANATEVKSAPAPAAAAPKPAKVKVDPVFTAPTVQEFLVLRTDGPEFPEKIKCGLCDRRIRTNQNMVKRDDVWFHAVEADCIAKPAIPHHHKVDGDVPKTGSFQFTPPTDAWVKKMAEVDEPGGVMACSPEILAASGGDPNNQAAISAAFFDQAKTILAAKAEPGTLLEQLETGAASVPEKSTSVPVPSTTSDNPPETKPLEQVAAASIPSVDAPATPRKRLTFLDDDQEIL